MAAISPCGHLLWAQSDRRAPAAPDLAAAAPAFNPDVPEEEKEEPEWNRFWMYWGIGGLALVFLCFVFYMEVSYVLLLWLAVTIIITTKAWLGSRNA